MLKQITAKHKASRGLSATVELFVLTVVLWCGSCILLGWTERIIWFNTGSIWRSNPGREWRVIVRLLHSFPLSHFYIYHQYCASKNYKKFCFYLIK